MILTQTISDLGFPPAKVVGTIMFEIEGPINSAGYDEGGVEGAMTAASEYVHKKYGPESLVLNAKIEVKAGSAHHSYGRIMLRVTGDLYLMTPEMAEKPKPEHPYERPVPDFYRAAESQQVCYPPVKVIKIDDIPF